MEQKIHLIVTGGTIDAVFDPRSDGVVMSEASSVSCFLDRVVQPGLQFSQEILSLKDSRELNDEDRAQMLQSIKRSALRLFLITHGTYTMEESARYVKDHLKSDSKVVVFTGAVRPLEGFAPSDAPFNLGFALGSLLSVSPGVYIALNGVLTQQL